MRAKLASRTAACTSASSERKCVRSTASASCSASALSSTALSAPLTCASSSSVARSALARARDSSAPTVHTRSLTVSRTKTKPNQRLKLVACCCCWLSLHLLESCCYCCCSPRKCFVLLATSQIAHSRTQFANGAHACSKICTVTHAGSARSCRPMQMVVARSRIRSTRSRATSRCAFASRLAPFGVCKNCSRVPVKLFGRSPQCAMLAAPHAYNSAWCSSSMPV